MSKLQVLALLAATLSLAGLSDAQARGWSTQSTITTPRGSSSYSGSGSCGGGSCSSQGTFTGAGGRTATRQGATTCSGGTCTSSGGITGQGGRSINRSGTVSGSAN